MKERMILCNCGQKMLVPVHMSHEGQLRYAAMLVIDQCDSTLHLITSDGIVGIERTVCAARYCIFYTIKLWMVLQIAKQLNLAPVCLAVLVPMSIRM